jgi:hypothetical protein
LVMPSASSTYSLSGSSDITVLSSKVNSYQLSVFSCQWGAACRALQFSETFTK